MSVSSEPPASRKQYVSYSRITPDVITPDGRDGQRWISTVKIPYESEESRICLIAWVGGLYQIVEDRREEVFSLTGMLSQSLSPEIDMKSQIEFIFSHDIYSDTGALYSSEYIARRHEAKTEFLKHFDIVPNIPLSVDNLVLTPSRAVLTLPLVVDTKYNVSVRSIRDIYGRSASETFEIMPKREPFLSLRLADKKQIYTTRDTIPAKLYTLSREKNTHTLSLCRVSLDEYARIERMLTDASEATSANVSRILSWGEGCRTKEVVSTGSSYVADFRINDFFTGNPEPGLYLLYFRDVGDIEKYSRFVPPIALSIIDTHLTLKVDASGKMMVLATDILTGKPREWQEITLLRNISRTYIEKWNQKTGQVEREYIPLLSQAFATGISIGKTDKDGYVDQSVDTLKGIEWYDSNPYGLTFQSWWDYEGRYDSFLVSSQGAWHLGYLVSTWNDGITGYNFGIKESDYSYQSRGRYTSYIHTDRKLYLPWEKVHIHAIIRENLSSLTPPKDEEFDVTITDPLGRETGRQTVKASEYGSLSIDYTIPKDGSLGLYSVNIISKDTSLYIENSYTSFQVEVFKNPTFTSTVELKSPDLVEGAIPDLRKVTNTDPYSPWYSDIYKGDFTIEGIVKARYYNGATIKNTPFTYRVYKSEYYPQDFWGDCFWWCYWEPPLELYTEGSGSIDADGFWVFRVPVAYTSSYADYQYTVEVTVRDALSWEEVTTPGSLIVKLPNAYKGFSLDNPLTFTPKKKILSPTEPLVGTIIPKYGKWDVSLAEKYRYSIYRREYDETWIDDIRTGKTRITTSRDVEISSGVVLKSDFSLRIPSGKAGEYHMKITPKSTSEVPSEAISDTIFYISGPSMDSRDNTLRVIPERTIYRVWETARVMIQVPFTGSYLLITREKWWVVHREYTYLSGNSLTREWKIDDTMIPNAYVGVVALRPWSSGSETKSYAVWYGEIITDIADKKSVLTVVPDKTTYKNRDTANIDITLTDRSGNPLTGEVTLMVVDESLIRILGNIDLDIIPKFYQKYPFTVKTALSVIGIERGQYLSRKWSIGWWGTKWWWGVEIASRTIFENTAYYNPSIITDINGKAKVSFILPDNITNYRIIAIANTKSSHFSVAEKPIEIRKDYVLEVTLPMTIRKTDTFTIIASAFNSTKRVTNADVNLSIWSGSSRIVRKGSVSMGVLERKGTSFTLSVPDGWEGSIPYTLELREWEKILDAISWSLPVSPLPVLTDVSRSIEIMSGTTFTHILAPVTPLIDPTKSLVRVTLGHSYLSEFRTGLASLIAYPYGCIEQTIASTLPNRIALSLSWWVSGSGFDATKARENVANGLKKIFAMQHLSWGWTYWEGATDPEPRITPYVLRTLLSFREMGETIPDMVLTQGVSYILTNEWEYNKSADTYADAVWTLALLRDPSALSWWEKIDVSKLSRHGYISYMYAAQKLGKYSLDMEKVFASLLDVSSTSDAWYWNTRSDKAIFVQLLLERRDREKALRYLDPLIRASNIESYYVSTQEKLQFLLALVAEMRNAPIPKSETVALRSDGLITDLSLSRDRLVAETTSTREKVGTSYTLRRSGSSNPLIVTTRIQDVARDVTKLPAYSTGGITLTRTFELVDESKGVDRDGNFVSLSPVASDMTFRRGELYKVTLKVTLASTGDDFSHLAIEDFLPGAWRPINQKFSTESSLIRNQNDENYWSYTESRPDRILAHMTYGYWSTRTYTYYFRPELLWDYILPPATTYFMYDPDVHAYTTYSRVKVEE
jgi:alpha-2-macroglobulin